jgi:hypothetical protein
VQWPFKAAVQCNAVQCSAVALQGCPGTATKLLALKSNCNWSSKINASEGFVAKSEYNYCRQAQNCCNCNILTFHISGRGFKDYPFTFDNLNPVIR